MKTIKCIKDVRLPFDDIVLYKSGKTYEYTKSRYGITIMSEWNNLKLLLSPDELKYNFRKWDILKVKIL
jgi:hypothetical protein